MIYKKQTVRSAFLFFLELEIVFLEREQKSHTENARREKFSYSHGEHNERERHILYAKAVNDNERNDYHIGNKRGQGDKPLVFAEQVSCKYADECRKSAEHKVENVRRGYQIGYKTAKCKPRDCGGREKRERAKRFGYSDLYCTRRKSECGGDERQNDVKRGNKRAQGDKSHPFLVISFHFF